MSRPTRRGQPIFNDETNIVYRAGGDVRPALPMNSSS